MSRRVFRKIFGALLIIASLVVASIPTSDVVADEAVRSDFEISGTTLLKYTGTASTVSVPDSVKEIAEEAFAGNTSITALTLPSSLKKIGYAAFSGCNRLSKVVIPDSVEEIGTAAFCNDSLLTDFTLGKNVKNLGTGVFAGCNMLSSISDNDYFKCSGGAIYDKRFETLYEVLPNSLVKKSASSNDYVVMTDYVMPNTVVFIKPYAFYGCKNIKSVTFSNNLTEIPAYAFSYCNGLSSLKIPYSVSSIDTKAFENCVNLETVEMPISVSFIHKTAFDGCSKLNIEAPVDSYAYNWFKTFDRTSVNIIDSEDNDSDKDNSSTDAEERIPIDGLIGETVIVGRQAVFFLDSSSLSVKSNVTAGDYADIISDMENVLQTETHGKGLSLPKFTVLGNRIADKAFYAEESLLEYDIQDGIETIGDFAFARTGLTSITIPDSVTKIEYGAFYHCDNLSNISVPASVNCIEPSAFAKTRMLDNWFLYGSSDFLIMGDGILVAYKGSLTDVSIPDGVKQIGPECFMNHKEIMEVAFPESLEKVCEDAFNGCSNLRTFKGGMGLKCIEDRAFLGCPVNTIRMVDTVEAVGLGAYNLSTSTLGDAYKTVVFQGSDLPKLINNKTATRLTNESYRVDAFEGVKVAVVNDESTNRVGTVLDRNVSGFSGLICVISEENNSYFNGTLKIIDCTLTKEEAESFYIPSTMYIYGKGYNFLTEELDSVLNMAKAGSYYEPVEDNNTYVSFTGSDKEYALAIEPDASVNEEIKEAYRRIYADNIPSNLTTFTISLKEKNSSIGLSKFGKQYLPISMKLPNNVPTSNLHVICIDEDGQLEDLPFSVVGSDDGLKVEYEINHTGNYGLYSFNSSSVSKFNLDDSPDTGDRIHPKWYLAIGLLSFGVVLVLYRNKKEILSV